MHISVVHMSHKKKTTWDMSQVVPQALPPVPQVPLRLYGNQALDLSFVNVFRGGNEF